MKANLLDLRNWKGPLSAERKLRLCMDEILHQLIVVCPLFIKISLHSFSLCVPQGSKEYKAHTHTAHPLYVGYKLSKCMPKCLYETMPV